MKEKETWILNPIIRHIIDDFVEEDVDIGTAVKEAQKLFEKIPKKDRIPKDNNSFTCQKYNQNFILEKE